MSGGRPIFLAHPSSLDHETGAHPERPLRIERLMAGLRERDFLGWECVESPAVSREVLELVHPAAYVDTIARVAAGGGGYLDADTVMSAGSFDAALHACGGAVEMVSRLLSVEGDRSGGPRVGFSAHRPPGHHALAERAMGFCLFNNIAVAASYALRVAGAERVLILDWDVHHGNGTGDIFWQNEQVLFVSVHQSPLWPGSGGASEVGTGLGRGYTVNLPVPSGSGDDVFVSLVRDVAVPLARLWRPSLVLVSAGFDAHRDDPLASCCVTEEGFGALGGLVRDLGVELGVPVGCVLEGGYNVDALVRSVLATMSALVPGGGDDGGGVGLGAPEGAPDGPVDLAVQARERLAEFWPDLAA